MDQTHGGLFGPLASRTISAFPLSIGTSIAFESLFAGRLNPYDPARLIPQQIDIAKYKQAWINLSTLFRNIIGAMPSAAIATVHERELKQTIEFEIEIIRSLFKEEGRGLCEPVFYFCDYKTPYTKQNHNAVQLRVDRTDGQKLYTDKLNKTFQLFFREHPHDGYLKLDAELTPIHPVNAIVLTHVPWDLLSQSKFNQLDLLESHSGKLKSKNLWYSKYYPMPGEELNTLPFTRKLLLIFGDKVMFKPMDIRFRKMILDISRNRRWTPMTSRDKIVMDLEIDLKEKYLVEMYKHL